MVLKVISVVGLLTLTACVAKESVSVPSSSVLEAGDIRAELQAPVLVEKETEISSEVLFLLMTAEIAGQREQYGIALDGYLRAAQQVKDPEVIKRAAKIALFVQDPDKLKQALDLWQEVEPDSVDVRFLTAVAALNAGDRALALESIEFVLLNDPQVFDEKALALIKSLNDQPSVDLAQSIFVELSAKYPANAQLFFVQALLDAQSNNVPQAQLNISQALALKPDWPKASLLQAQLYISKRDLAAATSVLQGVVAKQDNVQIRERIAQLLMQQERWVEAEEALQSLIENDPENDELKFKLALVYLQTNKEAQAREGLLALVTKEPFKDKASFYLARMDAANKRYNEALIWFDGVKTEPFKYEAEMNSLLILMEQERYAVAIDKIASLKAAYPEKINNFSLFESEAYSRLGEHQKGFDVLSNALLSDPDNEKILFARALLADKVGDMQTLEADLLYLIEKDPNDSKALNALGYTLVDKTTRYREAQAYLDRAIAIRPNEPIIMDSYGWLLFKLNRYEESLSYLQKAYEMEPQAEIAGHLVEVLWVLQRQDQAKAVLLRALAKNPEDKMLLEVQVRLLGVR